MRKKTATEEYMDRERKSIYTTTVDMDGLVIGRGLFGPHFKDIEGNTYLDFTSQVSLLNTGYCQEYVEGFLRHQMKSLYSCISADWPFQSETYFMGEKKVEISRASLAEKLIKISKHLIPGKRRVMFEVSGATALNAAMKIAKIAFRKKESKSTCMLEKSFKQSIFIPSHYDDFRFSFLTFRNAFGGRHGDTQCITNSKTVQLWGASSSCAFGRLTVPSKMHGPSDIIKEADFLIKRISNYAPVVAFVFEPIQGEGGIFVPDKKGLKTLVDYLRKKNIYIIADEIQSGFGRAGKMFACEHFGIEPDMVVLSKSLGAGLPIGAVVANADKFPDLEPGMHSGSHHCPPMACAAAIANLGVIQRSLPGIEPLSRTAFNFLRATKESFPGIIKEVRGLGLMIGVDFYDVKHRSFIVKKAKEKGLLLAPCGKSAIRICPPINISKEDLIIGLAIFGKTIEDI